MAPRLHGGAEEENVLRDRGMEQADGAHPAARGDEHPLEVVRREDVAGVLRPQVTVDLHEAAASVASWRQHPSREPSRLIQRVVADVFTVVSYYL